jgi:hypothetical protein
VGSYGEVVARGFFQRITDLNNEPGDENVLGGQLILHFRPPPLTNR